MKKMISIGAIGLVCLAAAVCFVSCEDNSESADYKVVKQGKKEGFEIRDYAELVLVSAPMDKADKKEQNQSFRKLFKYISKGNEKEQKIPMTTPVFASDGDDGEQQGKMYFVMPAEMKLKDVPKPMDGKLEVSKRPKARYAVYRYSGRPDAEKRAEQEKKLLAWVKEQKLKVKGDVIWAGYNPPWTPGPMRRNEVLVEIAK